MQLRHSLTLIFVLCLTACQNGVQDKKYTVENLRCNGNPALVASAVEALSSIHDYYHTPSAIRRYSAAQKGPAPQFIQTMCQLYQDDVAALEARLTLLTKIKRPQNLPTQPFDQSQTIWEQLTSSGLKELLKISKNLAKFRTLELKFHAGLRPGTFEYEAVPPLSECELRFIFKNYLSLNKSISTKQDFAEYEMTRQLSAKNDCTVAEQESIYLFRGESGLVPSMYEVRSLNLLTTSIIDKCMRSDAAILNKKYCEDLSTRPFWQRQQLVLALLRSQLFYDKEFEPYFFDSKNNIFYNLDEITYDLAPVYKLNETTEQRAVILNSIKELQTASQEITNTTNKKAEFDIFKKFFTLNELGNGSTFSQIKGTFWNPSYSMAPDQGIFKSLQAPDEQPLLNLRDRFTAIFNRQLDYYSTNAISLGAEMFANRFSIWLATSSYPHQAYKFTISGFNRDRKRDNKSIWLSIFKIKRANLYQSDNLMRAQPIDFSKMWFDEQTFATDSLARTELAWDKLGSPRPEELNSLFLLDEIDFNNLE